MRGCLTSSAVLALALLLAGCGGGPVDELEPPSIVSGVRPAPGTARYHSVSPRAPGQYTFSGADGDAVRIGIEDSPVDFTQPFLHGRVQLEGAAFTYWRPLADQRTQNAFASCTEADPCRVFYGDSGGDRARLERLARTVLEQEGLPNGDDRWFLYDTHRGPGRLGWSELPGAEQYVHGTTVASVALGRRFQPYPGPQPVIVPMARNLDADIDQSEPYHHFSTLIDSLRGRDPKTLDTIYAEHAAEIRAQHAAADVINASYGFSVDINAVHGRNSQRTWREDLECLAGTAEANLQCRSGSTGSGSPTPVWRAYVQAGTAEKERTLRVWATGNNRATGIRPSVLPDDPYARFPNVLAGDGARSLDALGPYYFPELRGQHIAVTALSTDEERLASYANPCGELPEDWDASRFGRHFCLAAPGTLTDEVRGTSFAAPLVSGVLARMMARFPGVSPRELVKRLMDTADDYREDGFDGDVVVVEESMVCPAPYCVIDPGGQIVWTAQSKDEASAKATERFRYLYGAGRVDVDAEDPDEDDDKAGAFAPVSRTRMSTQTGRSAPVAATRMRAPAAYGALSQRMSAISLAAFDAVDFPFFYRARDFVADTTEFDPAIPEFLPEPSDTPSCHSLQRLAPGLVCAPSAADASLHALVSPDGTGAAWHLSDGVALSAFTRREGRLDGAASGAFSFDGGSSLAALRLGREWAFGVSDRWRLDSVLNLTADLPRGPGGRQGSIFEAGPSLLSDWSLGVAHHTSRDRRTRLALSQPPRAETGHGRLTAPVGRRYDRTRLYETHRLSLVPSHRQLTLRLSHQRPILGGDLVVSAHRTGNPGHRSSRSDNGAGLAYRVKW